jgi:DNA-binding NtrC family response regulator
MNTSLENKTILIVDDDADIREAARSALEDAGGSVILAHSVDAHSRRIVKRHLMQSSLTSDWGNRMGMR